MTVEVNSIFLAAHELKSPLALMRQLALSLDSDSPEQVQRSKTQLISVSERALRQVSDLTKISRLEDGLFQLEPVSVRSVCDEVTKELRQLFRYNHRDLTLSYRNKSRLVVANHDLLYSVIYNFCLNAMHYSDYNTKSQLTIQDSQGKVRINIRDFGPALPTDIWRKLQYEWISQPTSIAMRPSSSGLGLYIASKFSRYMHAEIGAVRHRDGTSFYVALPVSTQLSLL